MTDTSGLDTVRPRRIAVVTVGRSDFGIYESVLEQLRSDPSFELRLMVTGAHFAPQFGNTVSDIEEKGLEYEGGLEMLLATDSPQGIGKSVGLGIISFAQAFATEQPDILVVLGDRIEMLCGPVAAMPYNIPVAHIHGGAVTEGAVDELVRHAITKMSHLHFVSCQKYGDRLVQMGEEQWRVHNVGAAGLDRLLSTRPLSRSEVSARVGMELDGDTLLVTYHPVTLESNHLEAQLDNLLKVLDHTGRKVVLTYPNADTGHSTIMQRFHRFSEANPGRVSLLKHAGTQVYAGLMASVAAMVGNSSSGIVEAPSFGLPVVNIGTREDGKVRAGNVIDVGYTADQITDGIQKATSAEFRLSLRDKPNPYGNGQASQRIARVLRTVTVGDSLIRKKFVDLDL